MTHKKPNIAQSKTERKKYSPQFKEQALERAVNPPYADPIKSRELSSGTSSIFPRGHIPQ
jgi:transposase-like protein